MKHNNCAKTIILSDSGDSLERTSEDRSKSKKHVSQNRDAQSSAQSNMFYPKTQGSSKKRTNEHLDDDDQLSDDNVEVTIFNYLTGLYETVKRRKTLSDEESEECNLETSDVIKAGLTTEEVILNEEEDISNVVATEIENPHDSQSATSKSEPLALSNAGRTSSCESINLPGGSQSSVPISENELCLNFLNTSYTHCADINMDQFVTEKDLPLNQSNLQLLDSYIENTSTSQDMEQPIIDNVTGSNSYRQTTNHIPGDGVINNIDNTPQNKFICSVCQFKAVSRQQLFFHLYELHLQGEYSITFRCKVCNFKSNHKRVMIVHEKHHNKGDSAIGLRSITDDVSLSKNVEITVIREKSSANNNGNERIRDNVEIEVTGEKSGSHNDENEGVRDNVEIEVIGEKQSSSNNNENETVRDNVEIVEVIGEKSSLNDNENETARDNGEMEVVQEKSDSSNEESEMVRDDVEIEVTGEKQPSSNNGEDERVRDNPNYDNEDEDTNLDSENLRRCFDCDYKTRKNNILQDHALKHLGSKFTCTEHASLKNNNCRRCIYEDCLLKVKKKVQTCNVCGYTTIRIRRFKQHQANSASCSRRAIRSSKLVVDPSHSDNAASSNTKCNSLKHAYKCFDCDYKSMAKVGLKHHAMLHLNSKFMCAEHSLLHDDCDACIYQSSLLYVSKRLQICQHCDYKTFIQSYFEAHQLQFHSIHNKGEVYRNRTKAKVIFNLDNGE